MINAATRAKVRARAGDRCEYCHLQRMEFAQNFFAIEHIIARKHGGGDEESNLALSCYRCNLHKGPNLSGIDSQTGELVRLFHPRNDVWSEHFRSESGAILGLTPCGRATAMVLTMNSRERIELRALQIEEDWRE